MESKILGRKKSRKNFIHLIDQIRDGFFGFVPHIGNAEGLPFDFAITSVNREFLFLSKCLHEPGDIHIKVVLRTAEGFGCIFLFWQKFEPFGVNPLVNQRIEMVVSGKPIFQTFFKNRFNCLKILNVVSVFDALEFLRFFEYV